MKGVYCKIFNLVVVALITGFSINGQDTLVVTTPKVEVSHGSKGFEFKTSDNRFLLQLQSRLQFRFATPADQDPISFEDFNSPRSTVLKINRARFKVGGHAYKPWLKYYWEYDVAGGNLLDFRLMIEKWEWMSFKIGQWKVEYTGERVVSSGKQQMVDRSLINRPFTIDRQQGVEVYGHLNGQGPLNFNYWAAVLTGTGRSNRVNDDEHLMYFGRFQWNFLGRELKFSGSDLELHQKPAAFVAFAAVTNRSPFTRFSTSGGGSLPGFEDGMRGQYRVNQMNLETAFKYRGFSWWSEIHNKEIIDRLNGGAMSTLQGYYAQAGYFFHQAIDWWPAPLELAVRQSGYYPNTFDGAVMEDETSVAANWFFNGHANKLTFEVSHFDYIDLNMDPQDEWRFRVQWDISL